MNKILLSEQVRRLGRVSLRFLPILMAALAMVALVPRVRGASGAFTAALDMAKSILGACCEGQPCNNDDPGSPTAPPGCPDDGDDDDDDDDCDKATGSGGPQDDDDDSGDKDCNQGGVNLIAAYSGNASRTITDLTVHGAVGQFGLPFVRQSFTRANNMTASQGWFGRECGFAHNWQYYMRDIAPLDGRPRVKVAFPDGRDVEFWRQEDGVTWLPAASVPMRLFEQGNDLTLRDRAGFAYHFKRRAYASGATYYRVESIQDDEDNTWILTYFGESNRLKRVTEPAGRYIDLIYQNQAFVKQQEVILATSAMDAAKGQWIEVQVTSPTAFRFLAMHFVNDWRNAPSLPVAEIEFYDQNNQLLSGAPIGSDPVYATGEEPPMAFDDNTATHYRYAYIRNGYVGLDLGEGNEAAVSRIRYFIPDIAGLDHVAKAEFVGLNELDQSHQILTQVKGSDGRAISYQYGTYTDPSGYFSWMHLTGVTYPDAAEAAYGYAQVHDFTQPLLEFARDPRVQGKGTIIQYVYDPNTALGFVRKELSGVTLEVIAETAHDGAHKPNVVYPNGRVVKNVFTNPNARLQSVTDGMGHTTTYTYDQGDVGYAASVTDPLGRTTTFERNEYGAVLRETGPDGRVTEYTRDSRNRVLAETVSGPGVYARTTAYTRDANGRVTRKDYPDGSFEEWTYNPFGQRLTHRDRNGNSESWTYDARGLMIAHTDFAGHATSYAFDALDRVASVNDPLNHATAMAYNDRGQVTRTTYADGTSAAMAYDEFGNRLAMTNELGHAWTWTYDEFRQPLTASDPLGRATTYAYGAPVGGGGGCGGCAAGGKPTRITLPSGKTTVYGYDLDWNLISATAGFGTPEAATTQYGYDAARNVTAVTDPLGKTTSMAYDSRNRMISTTDPLNFTARVTFDLFGNRTSEIRHDGGVTTNLFDVNDRLVASTDPKNQKTEFDYDPNGNVLSLIDPRGNAYSWEYDALNRKTRMTYPAGSFESWEYDAARNLVRHTTRAGQVMTASFDLRNRPLVSDWSDVTPDITRAYDAAGRLTLLDNVNARLTYAYDAANQLLAETTRLAGSAVDRAVAYGYNPDGNRATVTYPDGRVASYSYTARNQIAAIASDASTVAAYAYDFAGRRLIKTLENGARAVYAHDDKGQVLTVDHQTDTMTWLRFGYAYDAVGNRTHKATTDASGTRYDLYGHDPVDQLINAQYNALDVTGTGADRIVDYLYDAAGNRQTVTDNGAPTAYAANGLNQYTHVDGITPAHDANGNLSSYGVSTYAYDAQNRLVSASDSSTAATFVYDARNRQVARTINGVTTVFVWDGWSLLEERDSAGNLIADYLHGPVIDEILSKTDASGTVYYHHDALGSTVALTDEGGVVVETYRYDVYGSARMFDAFGAPSSESGFGNRFLFAGKESASEMGIYESRRRAYSPLLGRFLQTDPIGFAAGDINLYRYVFSNPVSFIDPFGESFWDVVKNLFKQKGSPGPGGGEVGDAGKAAIGAGYTAACIAARNAYMRCLARKMDDDCVDCSKEEETYERLCSAAAGATGAVGQ